MGIAIQLEEGQTIAQLLALQLQERVISHLEL